MDQAFRQHWFHLFYDWNLHNLIWEFYDIISNGTLVCAFIAAKKFFTLPVAKMPTAKLVWQVFHFYGIWCDGALRVLNLYQLAKIHVNRWFFIHFYKTQFFQNSLDAPIFGIAVSSTLFLMRKKCGWDGAFRVLDSCLAQDT